MYVSSGLACETKSELHFGLERARMNAQKTNAQKTNAQKMNAQKMNADTVKAGMQVSCSSKMVWPWSDLYKEMPKICMEVLHAAPPSTHLSTALTVELILQALRR